MSQRAAILALFSELHEALPARLAQVSGLELAGSAPPALQLLKDFLTGSCGDEAMAALAASVARVVVAG